MKDSRFMELVNLCVDQQLTPGEARELETELRASPSRHRTYLQYCRMQKACAQLFETERVHAPARPRLSRALADANRKITAAPFRTTTRRWWRTPFAIGGLASAAACVAFVFVLQKNPRQPASATLAPASTVATITQAEPAIFADTTPQVPATTVASIQTQPRRFRLPAITSLSSEQHTLPSPLIEAPRFSWARDLQMRPIRRVSTEDFILDLSRFQKPQIGAAILRIPSMETQETATERTVIEFRR